MLRLCLQRCLQAMSCISTKQASQDVTHATLMARKPHFNLVQCSAQQALEHEQLTTMIYRTLAFHKIQAVEAGSSKRSRPGKRYSVL
jgi:hypothetical protein